LNVQKNDFQKAITEQMKKYNFLIIIGLCILTLSSCLKDDDNYPSQNYPPVTILNYYPKTTGVYYTVNGSPLNQVNPEYKGISGFFAIPGNKSLQVIDRAENKNIVDTTFTFADSIAYSCFVYGTVEKPTFIRVSDIGLENLGTKDGVRFFHLANNVGKVNFKIGTQEIDGFEDRTIETPSTLAQTQIYRLANSGKFTITAEDEQGNVLAKIDDFELVQGRHYSFMLYGTKGSSDFPLGLMHTYYNN